MKDEKLQELFNELTDKQRLFVREYMKDRNGTRAAIAAGYAESSAHVTASRLVHHPSLARIIQHMTRDHLTRLGVSTRSIIDDMVATAKAALDAGDIPNATRLHLALAKMTGMLDESDALAADNETADDIEIEVVWQKSTSELNRQNSNKDGLTDEEEGGNTVGEPHNEF